MRVRSHISSQSGTAMIEMALVLPILLLLIMGILDFARGLNYWNDTNQLAAEAARHAAVNRNPGTGTFEQYVRSRAETKEVREGTSTSVQRQLKVCRVDPDNDASTPIPNDPGNPITIRVETRFWMIPLVADGIRKVSADPNFASLRLRGEATMRLEQRFDPVKLQISTCPIA